MDKNYIERPKKFNQNEYKKQHYINFNAALKPDVSERVNDYCKNNKMSKAEFIALAIDILDK